MVTAATLEGIKHKTRAVHDELFNEWRAKPEVKLLLSLLPPCETETQKEVFQTLQRSLFDAGCEAGKQTMACSVYELALDSKLARR